MNTPILNQITAGRLTDDDKIYMLMNVNAFSDDIKSSIFSLRYQWCEETHHAKDSKSGSAIIRNRLVPEQKYNSMKEFINDITMNSIPKDTNEGLIEYFTYVDKLWKKYSHNSGLSFPNKDLNNVLHSVLSDIFIHYARAYDIRTILEESDITRYNDKNNATALTVQYGMVKAINLIIDMVGKSSESIYPFTVSLFNLIRMLNAKDVYHQFINIFIEYGTTYSNGGIIKSEIIDLLDSVLGDNPTRDIMDILNKVPDSTSRILHFPSYSNTIDINTNDLLYSVVNDGFTVYGSDVGKTATQLHEAVNKLTPDVIKTYIGNREPLFDFPGEIFNPHLLNIIFEKHYAYCIYENKDGAHRLFIKIGDNAYCMFRLFEASDCVFGISIDMDEDESREIIKIPVPKGNYVLKVGESVWQ